MRKKYVTPIYFNYSVLRFKKKKKKASNKERKTTRRASRRYFNTDVDFRGFDFTPACVAEIHVVRRRGGMTVFRVRQACPTRAALDSFVCGPRPPDDHWKIM